MKKILSLVLALTLVLSSMSMAFADTFPDIDEDDRDLVEAAELLNSLGVLEGNENGEYMPEAPLTREAMAKVVVHLLGYTEDDYEGYGNEFTDAQGLWSTDAIGLAADAGVVNGYGDGIFAPTQNVTYLQAAIMLIRALGYTDASLNNGVDAYDAGAYRSKALQLGLFDGVAPNWDAPATRGDLAIMSYNNLNNQLVSINSDNEVIGLEDSGNPVSLLSRTAETYEGELTPELVADAQTDVSMYTYQVVTAYYVEMIDEDGDEYDSIIYVADSDSDIVEGYVYPTDGNNHTDDDEIFIDDETVYDVLGTANVFFNGAETAYTNVYNDLADAYAYVTLILDEDGDVANLVGDIVTDEAFIEEAYEEDDIYFEGIALPQDDDGDVDLDRVTVTGEVNDIFDIEVDDVVKAYESEDAVDEKVIELVVTRDSVEGMVTRSDDSGTEVYIDTIGDYVDVYGYSGYTSLTVGEEGTFYLDENGDIFAWNTEDEAAESDYMLITGSSEGWTYTDTDSLTIIGSVTMLDSDGEYITYDINEYATYTLDNGSEDYIYSTYDETNDEFPAGDAPLESDFADGAIVSTYTLDDDEIVEIELVTFDNNTAATVTFDSATFVPSSDIAIFTSSNGVTDDFEAGYDVDDLVAMYDSDEVWYKINEDGEYELIVVDESIIDAEIEYALIVDRYVYINSDSETVYEFDVYINGVMETILSTADYYDSPTTTVDGVLYDLELEGSDISDITDLDQSYVELLGTINVRDNSGNITTASAIVSGDRFNYTDANGSSEWFYMDENAAVYVIDVDGDIRVGDIDDVELYNVDVTVYGAELANGVNILNAIVIQENE